MTSNNGNDLIVDGAAGGTIAAALKEDADIVPFKRVVS